MDISIEESEDDPQLPDESDPEFQNEILESFWRRKLKPEDIKDVIYASLYSKWLNDRGK